MASQEKNAAWDLHSQAARRFHEAHGRLLSELENAEHHLRDIDTSGLETVLSFLEADPYFCRSGYLKEMLLPRVCHLVPLPSPVAARLRQIVLNRVQTFWGREFPFYKRLAYAVDSAALRAALDKLGRDTKDSETQARASAVLRYLSARSGR